MSCGSRSGPRWFCVWTQPQAEYRALQNLIAQDWDCYLPLCLERGDRINRRPDRIVPLFSRYLFVQMDPARDPWGSIQHSFGVGGLIRHAPDRPTPVPHGVVEHLLARTSSRSVVDDPGDAPRSDIPLGASVEVREGPMAGLRGIVTLSGPARCRVLLRLFAGTVPVSLPVSSLVVVAR
jgi:transcriptional antiterminator RfaH